MKKNILFIFTDQQRKDSLGCYGNTVCQTPVIDQLAGEGIRFDNAYTPTAICTPARASLVTGMKPSKHKLIANHERNVGYNEELEDHLIPFSRPLEEAGYNVGSIGKWHVGKTKGQEDFGFEGLHYPGWGETVHHPDYIKYLDEHGYPHFKVGDTLEGTFPNGLSGNVMGGKLEQPLEATFTYYLTEKVLEQMEQYGQDYKQSGRPFFLGMNLFGPHMPYFLPEKYLNMYDPNDIELPASFQETFNSKPAVLRNYSAHWCFSSYSEAQLKKIIAMYWGFVSLIDEQIGRVLDTLKRIGLENDTMIVFTTDHGSFEGHHKLYDKGPAMYEDIYNIPFIIKYPGIAGGRKESRYVSLLDLTATFVDEACGSVPEHYDGESLLPLLNNEKDLLWRMEIFAEFHGHHFPYPQRMIRKDKYKLIVNPPDIDELYNLDTDPHELINLINEPSYLEAKEALYQHLFQYLKREEDNFYHWMYTMYPLGKESVNESFFRA